MNTQPEDLAALLETEIGHYRLLKQALTREGRAGATGDIEALAAAGRDKDNVMAGLRACETRRHHILAQLAHPREGMTLTELAGCLPEPHGARLGELGRVLKKEVAEAHRINRANGDLMAHCLKLVQGSLAMLNHLLAPQLVYQPVGVPVRSAVPARRFSQRA